MTRPVVNRTCELALPIFPLTTIVLQTTKPHFAAPFIKPALAKHHTGSGNAFLNFQSRHYET